MELWAAKYARGGRKWWWPNFLLAGGLLPIPSPPQSVGYGILYFDLLDLEPQRKGGVRVVKVKNVH